MTAEQRQKAIALNELVRDLPGGVLIPSYPFLAARNGVVIPQAHTMAHWDAHSGGVPDAQVFRVVAASPAHWLLIKRQEEFIVSGPSGKYAFDCMIDVAVPTLVGYRTEPNALFRRIAE